MIGRDPAGYEILPGDTLDRDGNVIDATSHGSHAMNPIDRAHYRAEDWPEPPKRYRFRCVFCGTFDHTRRAARVCPSSASAAELHSRARRQS